MTCDATTPPERSSIASGGSKRMAADGAGNRSMQRGGKKSIFRMLPDRPTLWQDEEP